MASLSPQKHAAEEEVHRCQKSLLCVTPASRELRRFSNDTARLQKMHAVRNPAVGSQIKAVIELLYRGRVRRLNDDMDNAYEKETMESTPSALCVTLTRKALAAKKINEATYVVIAGNNAVFESPRSNPKTPSMRNGISGSEISGDIY
ncbi:hypothetical protein ACQ4PT_063443 [Festuca glaucescens]